MSFVIPGANIISFVGLSNLHGYKVHVQLTVWQAIVEAIRPMPEFISLLLSADASNLTSNVAQFVRRSGGEPEIAAAIFHCHSLPRRDIPEVFTSFNVSPAILWGRVYAPGYSGEFTGCSTIVACMDPGQSLHDYNKSRLWPRTSFQNATTAVVERMSMTYRIYSRLAKTGWHSYLSSIEQQLKWVQCAVWLKCRRTNIVCSRNPKEQRMTN